MSAISQALHHAVKIALLSVLTQFKSTNHLTDINRQAQNTLYLVRQIVGRGVSWIRVCNTSISSLDNPKAFKSLSNWRVVMIFFMARYDLGGGVVRLNKIVQAVIGQHIALLQLANGI
ncbi:hypothetical protein [Moraxella equi]|uniref:hypothetical protein n=1 Tax=Moraxella equi TaxID=60442 RepID=UPI00117C7B7C|nr:hypothetical protein [Moraxella equi]